MSSVSRFCQSFASSIVLLLVSIGIVPLAYSQTSKSSSTRPHPKYHKQLANISKEFKKDGFEIDSLFKDKRFEVYGSIGHKFTHSAEREAPTLKQYKHLLGFKKKVGQGVTFTKSHQKALNEAEKKYGISSYLITAIIGIESNFGKNIGSYNPFNVYVSMMAVDYRKDFAREQLLELLKFSRRKKLDVLSLKSSYAGAMSYAQFIPYSVNKWWVGDNVFDMKNSIMSIAHYLQYFKKRSGSISKAVHHYNVSQLYKNFVLDLAKAIKKRCKTQEDK
jgi:membrane-bound lytic murein transglycosylase B